MEIYVHGRRLPTAHWAAAQRRAVHDSRIAHAAEAMIDLVFQREPAEGSVRVWRAHLRREALFRDIDK